MIDADNLEYELRMKTNLGGPLAVLDSYYGQYTTMPDDATLRLDTIQQLYSPCMQSDYDYPPSSLTSIPPTASPRSRPT